MDNNVHEFCGIQNPSSQEYIQYLLLEIQKQDKKL